MRGSGEKKTTDEVEQLLEAAQDEMMLKLSIDSHMSRVSPDYLHPDLGLRFHALKSRSSLPPPSNHRQQPKSNDTESADDDLFARFAALKASLPSLSSYASGSDLAGATTSSDGHDQRGCGGVDDDEDEVDKVIRWAMDAARLDPSPPSGDDGGGGGGGDDDDDDDDSGGDDDDDDAEKGRCK